MNNINARMMLALFVVLILGFVGGYAVRGVHRDAPQPSTAFGLNNNNNSDNPGSIHDFWNRMNANKPPSPSPSLSTPQNSNPNSSPDGMIPQTLDLSVLVPKVHTLQTDKDVLITAEMPGLSPHNLDIQVKSDTVEIKGERQIDKIQDRPFRDLREEFSEVIKLPCKVDGSQAKSIFRDGILTIIVPKVLPEEHHRAG